MRSTLKLYFYLAVLLVFILSCSKSDDDADELNETGNTCKNVTGDLSGSYSFVKYEEAINSGAYNEKPVPSCMVEDKLILKSDGSTEYIDSGMSCNANLIRGTWAVIEGDKININSGPPFGYIPDGFISSFDCTYLVITVYDPNRVYRITLRK